MIGRWTRPTADDLTLICNYTADLFGAAQARAGIRPNLLSLSALAGQMVKGLVLIFTFKASRADLQQQFR